MNRYLMLLASLLTLVTVGFSQATVAAAKPNLPVIGIQQVDAKDADTYAMWLAKTNAAVKAKVGVDKYYRVYVGMAAGEDSGALFTVVAADSFATLTKNGKIVADDPTAIESRTHLNAVRELGPRTMYKAIRYDGAHAGGHIYNTFAILSDEGAYLKALDQLKALYESRGIKGVHINLYRVVAGRSTSTHLVSLNTPSAEALAAVLDSTNDPAIEAWIVAAGKFRTVVRNGTYREITQ